MNTAMVFLYLRYGTEDGLAKPKRVSELPTTCHKALLIKVYLCMCYLLALHINHGNKMVHNGYSVNHYINLQLA
jgi:hypothetical protein